MKTLKELVDDCIREESRQEALTILELSSDEDNKLFREYYKEEQYNICCLHLDFMKGKLVEAGKMIQKEDDSFSGDIFSQ